MGAEQQDIEREGRALLVRQARSQRRGIGLGILMGLVWTAGKVAIPRFVAPAVDQGIAAGSTDGLLRWSLLIAGVGAVSAISSGLRRWNALKQARRAEAELRGQVFAHLQDLHVGYHDRASTGDLMSRANTDLLWIQQLFSMGPMTVANAMIIAASVVLLVVTDPVLALFALIALPLLNWGGRRFALRFNPVVLRVQEESAQLATVVEEAVSGVRVVKGFGAEPVLARRLRVEAGDVYEASMETARVRARYQPALELLPNVSLVVVLGLGGHRVVSGAMTLGELVAFNVYLALMIFPLRMMGNVVATYQRAVASAGRVQEVLSVEPAVVDRPGAVALPAGGGTVELRDVTFGYLPGRPVLAGLDLVVEAGSSMALVGGTGSGKTTIARLLARFYDVDGGVVLLDGVDVRDLRLAEVRRAVATVFEETFLFGDSVRANIAFASPAVSDVSDVSVERAARLAGVHDFVNELPAGYATVVGERGFSLSGGQRQRIAIARAVVADARVLLLDDATSAVDPTKEHEIRGALAEVMRGRTTLVIAHRPATIALAEQVALLDHGRIVALGTHDELLDRSTRYREVLAAAAHDDTIPEPASGAPARGEQDHEGVT